MNKLLAFLLVLSTFLTFSCAALADNTVEFTQEYIDANGIPSIDEFSFRSPETQTLSPQLPLLITIIPLVSLKT